MHTQAVVAATVTVRPSPPPFVSNTPDGCTRTVGWDGMAAVAVASLLMGPLSDAVTSSLGDSVLVEVGLHHGFELGAHAANELVADHAFERVVPVFKGAERIKTTAVKSVLVTLRYRRVGGDAAFVFFFSLFRPSS